ncbi:MAG: hypothetical protein HQL56_08970 [Magnetococcales bacterium]|nr:hypothetical protein [Magnetococcales bacterium]
MDNTLNSIKCPSCGGRPVRIYQCSSCGEIRCSLDTCSGSLGFVSRWASSGIQCRQCHDGRYRSVDFYGREVLDAWRKKQVRASY